MERQQLDMDAYVARISTGPCFICQLSSGETRAENHIVYGGRVSEPLQSREG